MINSLASKTHCNFCGVEVDPDIVIVKYLCCQNN